MEPVRASRGKRHKEIVMQTPRRKVVFGQYLSHSLSNLDDTTVNHIDQL